MATLYLREVGKRGKANGYTVSAGSRERGKADGYIVSAGSWEEKNADAQLSSSFIQFSTAANEMLPPFPSTVKPFSKNIRDTPRGVLPW